MMKSKNLVLLFFTILIVFYACGNEEENLQKAACSLSLKTECTVSGQKYEKLGVVPEAVAAQMDADELAAWQKISTQFFINYDFIKTDYYQKHKADFLCQMLNLYEDAISVNAEPGKLILMSCNLIKEKEKALFLELTDTSEVVPSDTCSVEENETISCHMYGTTTFYWRLNNEDIFISVTARVDVNGTKKNYTCQWSDISTNIQPFQASLIGNKTDIHQVGNALYVHIEGLLTYKSASTYVKETGYMEYTPDMPLN